MDDLSSSTSRRQAVRNLPAVVAGTDSISVLEHSGEVRDVLESDAERDVRDAPFGLARISEQAGGQLKPSLDDPAERRRALRLEEQVKVAHGQSERLGHCRRR